MVTENPHEGRINLLAPPERTGIDLQAKPPVIRDEDRVRSAVQRADFALGENSPGADRLAPYFWAGHERRLRQQIAMDETMRNRNERYQRVDQLLKHSALTQTPLSIEERDFIMNVDKEAPVNPEIVLEQLYARRAIEEASRPDDNDNPSDYDEAVAEDPDEAERIKAGSMDFITKQEIAKSVYNGMKEKYDDTSWSRWGIDLAKSMVPFYTWSNLADRLDGIKTVSFLTGNNITEQLQGLYLLPADEFKTTLERAVDEIAESNVLDALYFAEAALSYSSSTALWDSVFFGLDTVDVATLGALTAVGTARYARRARSVARANADPAATTADRLAASGDLAGAAEARVTEKLQSAGAADPTSLTPRQKMETITRGTYAYFDPENISRNAGELGAERARRIEEQLTLNHNVLMRDLEASHVQRLGPEALAKAFARTEELFRRTNHKLEDAIVDVRPANQSEHVFAGVDHVEFLLGRKDATSFARPSQAEFHAERIYRLPKGGYNIVEREGNWFIAVTRTIDETDLSVAPFRIGTENAAPENFVNKYLAFLRNPDYIVSHEHSMARKVAVFGIDNTMRRMGEAARSIGKLSSNEADRLRDILDAARFERRVVTQPDGTQVSVQGRFYHTQAELESKWMQRHGSLPNEKESLAYWTFRQLMDYDHTVKELSIYRDKARLGIHQQSVGLGMKTEEGKFMYRNTPFFEGRQLDALPTDGDFTVAWHNTKTGKTQFGIHRELYPNQKESLQALIASGDAKIIQVFDPSDPAFRNFVNSGGEPVQYIVARDLKTKPLDTRQLPYNEGGHWMYNPGGAYIKQAKTRVTRGGHGRRVYDGDVTAHHQPIGAQAGRFAKAYNEAREMILRGASDAELDAFVARNLPQRSGREFRKMFKSESNPDGAFDLHSPFVVTQPGQRVADAAKLSDLYGGPVVDLAQSPHSLSGKINAQYAQERGERLTTIMESGTEANPVFKLDPAPMLNSYEALSRSSAQLARNRYLDDYKHKAVEDWVQQFADVVDAPVEAVRADPMRFLRIPAWREGADKQHLAAAQNTRRAILDFLGQETAEMQAWKWTIQKTVDDIYKARGMPNSKIIRAAEVAADTDPTTVARMGVFHAKLGMFNFVQFPLQGLAVIHAAAIDGSPVRAARANMLYWNFRTRALAEGNPAAEKKWADAAAKALDTSADVVEEAWQFWRDNGMRILGGHSVIDDALNPKVFQGVSGLGPGMVRKGFDSGKVFFNEGNNWHAGTSFLTAFLRFRDENPTVKITQSHLNRILDRGDLMYINMQRASNPAYQKGLASVPSQFYAYHARMMEQMLGHKLTGAEKFRLGTVYAAMWGVPITGGMYAGAVWPVHDHIRQAVLEQGIDIDSNIYVKFLMEGGASMLMEYLTGMNFDLGNRMGPGGMSWLRDVLDGQFLDVATGASGSFIGDMLEKMNPFGWAATQVFADGDDYFPVKTQDFVDVLKGMSLVNNSVRAYWAYTAGQWLDGRDRLIADFGEVSASAALMMVITGSTPQEVADMYLHQRSNRQEDQWKRQLEREVAVNYRRALKFAAQGDDKQSYDYFKRAYIIMQGSGYTPLERSAVGRRIIMEYGPLMEETAREFAKRDPELRLQRWLDREYRED